jgi:hypothetical protein
MTAEQPIQFLGILIQLFSTIFVRMWEWLSDCPTAITSHLRLLGSSPTQSFLFRFQVFSTGLSIDHLFQLLTIATTDVQPFSYRHLQQSLMTRVVKSFLRSSKALQIAFGPSLQAHNVVRHEINADFVVYSSAIILQSTRYILG